MKILVTGGAGFIGSHLIDYLIDDGNEVVCIDDLSLGIIQNIKHHLKKPQFKFFQMNILDTAELDHIFKQHSFDAVFHMAANSDIQMGAKYLNIDLEKTFMTSFHILEAMKNHACKKILFASSSAIYGEHEKSLNEDTGPLFPISLYGAAKLSSEAYISAFCENFDMQAWIIRFPNVIGERTTHGVIYDFINKLKNNPNKLEILGNGKQQKPYLYVKDLVEGMLFAMKNSNDKINYFNMGVDSVTTVTRIAEIIVKEMKLKNVQFQYTGGDRGWIGDVPRFEYDLSKINDLGWKAKRTSDEAVELAVKAVLS